MNPFEADEWRKAPEERPRTTIDNAIKRAFRKVYGWDPFRDGVPPGSFYLNNSGHPVRAHNKKQRPVDPMEDAKWHS